MMRLWLQLSPFWRFQLAGWAVFVAATLPLKYVVSGSVTGALILFAVRDSSSFLLTLGLRRIYRAFWSNSVGTMVALIVVSCTVGGLLQDGFFIFLHPAVSIDGEILVTHRMAFSVFYERTGVLLGWSSLYFGIRQSIEGIQKELRLALIESEKRQAQLQMLRAQMNPHFLFNALNAMQAQIGHFNPTLKNSVVALAAYLRFSLDHSTDEFIPMGLEYDAMMDYLSVEKLRFGEDLAIDSHIDKWARDAEVPGIILQPLLENAVKYGRDTSEVPLRIVVNVSRGLSNKLEISVSNTGQWVKEDTSKATHIGLGNVRRRLQLLYPGKHLLKVERRDGWVAIKIELPVAGRVA